MNNVSPKMVIKEVLLIMGKELEELGKCDTDFERGVSFGTGFATAILYKKLIEFEEKKDKK